MQSGWLNDNLNRAFPFLAGSVHQGPTAAGTLGDLPDNIIVDAGFIVDLAAGFIDGVHRIYLSRIERHGDRFDFVFASDAPGLVVEELVFHRTLASPLYAIEDAELEAPAASASASESLSLDATLLWSGYLISGDMSALGELLADGQILSRGSDTDAVLEPALVQNLANTYVSSLNLANADRTRATAPAGCPPLAWPHATGGLFVAASGLDGAVRFTAGYNAIVRQDAAENAIVLGAAAGAGAGLPCGEIRLFAGESAPAGDSLLEGGRRCNELIRSINGAGGRSATIGVGLGVNASVLAESHRIILDVNMNELRVCPEA